MRLVLALITCLVAGPGHADPGDKARAAALQLSEAALLLDQARAAKDRIAALTATVRAYESGLSAMREGLVDAALQERALRDRLAARDADLAEFLALLQTVSRRAETQAIVHPGGALPTIRAGLLASAVVPGLQERAAELKVSLDDLSGLMSLQEAGIAGLEEGLDGVRLARLQLSEALAKRSDLPPRQATNEAAMLALLEGSETLAAFADALLVEGEGARLRPGEWLPPVSGAIRHGFNAPDAAGIPRPGLVFDAAAQGLVIAPAAGNIRFAGPMEGQGGVVILEPEAGTLVILSGMARTFVQLGQIVSPGDPIGLMGGDATSTQEKLNERLRDSSLFGQETLYMEVRQGRGPIDPASILTPG